MSNLKIFTFGVNKAWVSANGDTNTPASWVEVPIVSDSTIDYTIQTAEVSDGEGFLQMQWKHTQRAKVTLKMKQLGFNILERMTGSPVSSSQGTDQIYFGRQEEITPPFTRLKLVQRAIDSNTNRGYAHVTIFKAQGELPTLMMQATTPGEFTVNFQCLAANYDENGNSIPTAYFRLDAVKSVNT